MRIAFHVPRASHLKPGYSGDKILVRGLIEELSHRGHDVHIVSRLNARNIWRGRISREELQSEIHRVRSAMERFAPDKWLVYGASTTNPDLICWRLASEPGSRFNDYVLWATDLGTGKRLPPRWRRLFARAHGRSLARSDWVAAYHPESRDALIRYGLPEQQVLLAPPAVCPWKRVPERDEARRRLGLPLDEAVLFCASRFPLADEHQTGKMAMLLNLVEASRALPPGALVLIAGEGPGRATLERAIASLPQAPLVRLVGPVPHEAMVWYYAACDCFVYPNPVNRPWLSVLEAQACGRAVVTMRTPSAEFTVRSGRTGLLASDLEEFREAIWTLATNRHQAHDMGQAAASYVAENHTLDVRIDLIERLLEKSNAETRPPTPDFVGSPTTGFRNPGAADDPHFPPLSSHRDSKEC